MGLFGSKGEVPVSKARGERVVRYSSGWAQMLTFLKGKESLRVLDIGPTSSTNINYITGLGHSVYMANLVEEACKPEWELMTGAEEVEYDVDGFLNQNFSFAGRQFDVVLLWDTLEYLPESLVNAVVARLHAVMVSGGLVFALFHSKQVAGEGSLRRYHLTDSDQLEVQGVSARELQRIYSARQIETLFRSFTGLRFSLAKDTLREVMVTR